MSEEQLKAFLEKVKADTSLQEQLKAASDADAVVSLAKEEGFSISADDLKNAQSELSEEGLESVAGGNYTDTGLYVALTLGYTSVRQHTARGSAVNVCPRAIAVELSLLHAVELSLLIKASAAAGVFYFFNHIQNPTNQPLIPGMIERSNY